MLYPPGFYYVKKQERLRSELLSEDKIANLLVFFDIIKPRRIEHLQNQELFSSDPYFSTGIGCALDKQGIRNKLVNRETVIYM